MQKGDFFSYPNPREVVPVQSLGPCVQISLLLLLLLELTIVGGLDSIISSQLPKMMLYKIESVSKTINFWAMPFERGFLLQLFSFQANFKLLKLVWYWQSYIQNTLFISTLPGHGGCFVHQLAIFQRQSGPCVFRVEVVTLGSSPLGDDGVRWSRRDPYWGCGQPVAGTLIDWDSNTARAMDIQALGLLDGLRSTPQPHNFRLTFVQENRSSVHLVLLIQTLLQKCQTQFQDDVHLMTGIKNITCQPCDLYFKGLFKSTSNIHYF